MKIDFSPETIARYQEEMREFARRAGWKEPEQRPTETVGLSADDVKETVEVPDELQETVAVGESLQQGEEDLAALEDLDLPQMSEWMDDDEGRQTVALSQEI